ncbi:MAG: AAC(3) family N-acetyltransferase [Eubacteriales bacterium]|nr:AAC(3) family N-acetyltransferase [Eubacteriales bacterium]
MQIVVYQDAIKGFREVGVVPGDTVLLQSALRPFGYVEGAGRTIGEALLETLGKDRGTLVSPAFSFIHEVQEHPVIDPANDPSEMGAISEAIRHFPGALRSIAYRHSFSAVGKNAEMITQVDPAVCVFDLRSAFGKMLALDTKVVLAGVTYVNSTSHHFGQYLAQVPDRHTIERLVSLKLPDGTLEERMMMDYQPRPTTSGDYYEFPYDFNKLGLWLEQAGKVRISHIGNAMIRCFCMRDLIDLVLTRYPVDQWIFFQDALPVELPDGKTATRDYVDEAGREDTAIWAVVDPDQICDRKKR